MTYRLTREEALAEIKAANNEGRKATLCGADLSWANLRGADLSWANLYGASLCRANLHRASLYGANLYRANLYGANLHGANLHGADGGLLQVSDTPSGQLTLIPTPDGWKMVIGCWSGTIADLATLLDAPDEEWPEARGETRIKREAYLRATLPLLEAHAVHHDDELQAVIEKWKD